MPVASLNGSTVFWLRYVLCEIGDSHSSVAEQWSLLGCCAVSLGQQVLTFVRILVPSSAGSSSARAIPEDCYL